MKYCIILVLTTAIFWACSGPDHNHHLATELDSAHQNQESDDGHDHTQLAHAPDDGHGDNQDTHRISMTQFSCNYEMFLEYSVKEKDKTAGFLFHITKLDDCSPFNDRDIEFQILADDGRVIASPHLHPEQPGILSAEQVMDTPGNLTGRLTIGTEKAEIFNFDLYRPDHIKTHENGEQNGILFTKEKQWITDFMVRPIERKTMHASVTAVADVLPRQDGYAQVVVPIAGILNPMHNPLVTMVGRQVQSGDVLAVLCPPLTGLSSWTSRQMAYEQAKSEYERAVRLYEKDAISKREMERLEREYLVQKDGFDFYLERQGTPQQKENDNNRNHFFVKAPIRGIITEVHAVMGQTLTVGDKMYTIVDPSAVWLKVNLHERDYYKLDRQIFGATVFLAGRDPLILEKKDIQIINTGDVMDTDSRTIPVLLRVVNEKRILKIGQVVSLDLYVSDEMNALCVPRDAVFNDGTQQIVYVQTDGELFEKRKVKTGSRYLQWICIDEGIAAGERIVTQGGYLLKLSSTQVEIGHGHAH